MVNVIPMYSNGGWGGGGRVLNICYALEKINVLRSWMNFFALNITNCVMVSDAREIIF